MRSFHVLDDGHRIMDIVCDKCGLRQQYDDYYRFSKAPKPWASVEEKQTQGYYLQMDYCKGCKPAIIPLDISRH